MGTRSRESALTVSTHPHKGSGGEPNKFWMVMLLAEVMGWTNIGPIQEEKDGRAIFLVTALEFASFGLSQRTIQQFIHEVFDALDLLVKLPER